VIRAAELLGIQIPGSATTRCWTRSAPAASAWWRWRASASRWRRAPFRVHRRAWWCAPSSPPGGRREGAARRDGAAAGQPPAGLPDVRQGRRVPAAEPGDVHRPGETRFHRRQAHVRQADRASPPQVLLDRERCIQCARCTRFSEQIAGDPFIELIERGPHCSRSASTPTGVPFDSYFSGNTVQICPVGALTGAAYRFRARPSTWSPPAACASTARPGAGSAPTTAAARSCAGWPATTPRSTRSGTATRAGGRSPTLRAVRTGSPRPLVRDDSGGVLRARVLARGAPGRGPRPGRRPRQRHPGRAAARGPARRRGPHRRPAHARRRPTPTPSSPGSPSATNDIDMRARPHSAEESAVPRRPCVAGQRRAGQLRRPSSQAPGRPAGRPSSPQDESPIVFLRLRKAVRARTAWHVYSLAVARQPAAWPTAVR
jgi:NADH-quinone oxidoreductase subunit G